ncbi:hypothetical protein [Paenibacillus durus]|uniref:hypothetical protein n=1 Tax=Paenibacillus durus TaxID=44251 RepID=UPI000B313C95|nr:hypothetical protein [Paenibacillus durus]
MVTFEGTPVCSDFGQDNRGCVLIHVRNREQKLKGLLLVGQILVDLFLHIGDGLLDVQQVLPGETDHTAMMGAKPAI